MVIPLPMFKVPDALCVRVPAPAREVPTVRVPLLVYVPLIVVLGIEIVEEPPNVLVVPEKVCTPVLAV